MADTQLATDVARLKEEITAWISTRLKEDEFDWIRNKSESLADSGEDWEFFTSFSAVPRHIGKQPLELTDGEQQQAESIRPGWKPGRWSVDELGRTLIALSIAGRGKEEFVETLEKTHRSSDIGEAEALYKSLAVMPWPEAFKKRAAEGIRSNMTSVFNAVALDNPYPADYFDEGAWNQMVLKAQFVGSPLYRIEGIDERINNKLADMLVDYAHERWAADRSVSPELWRPVGPFAEGPVMEDLRRVLDHPDELHRAAALLALADSPSGKAREMIAEHEGLNEKIKQEGITWETIGRRWEEIQN